jgi:hypothetical protein
MTVVTAFVVAPALAQEPAGRQPVLPIVLAGPAPASGAPPGQLQDAGPRALARDIIGDFEHLPARANVEPLAIGSVVALAVHPADPDVNGGLAGKAAHDVFLPGKVIGYWPVNAGAAVATYLVGRHAGSGKAARVGADLLRAQVVSGALTEAIKLAVRRERPDGGGRDSFPSGHASTAFASATVLARHLGWRWAVPAYIVASYVAVSRLQGNRHYLSDVVFGGTVGFVAAQTATRQRTSSFAVVPVALPGGVAVVVARLPRGGGR